MRALILLGLAAAIPCAAQPVSTAPWMTGTRLLELLTYPPGKGNLDLTPPQYADKEIARWYIEGVHDATEGRAWCYSERYHPAPMALHDDVSLGLRAMRPEQLKRNAADLIAEIWRKKWPCPERRSS